MNKFYCANCNKIYESTKNQLKCDICNKIWIKKSKIYIRILQKDSKLKNILSIEKEGIYFRDDL